MTRVLLTGAGGFVGSHVLRHLLVNTDWEVVCPVTFRHRGVSARLTQTMTDHADAADWHRRVQVVHHDLAAPLGHLDLGRWADAIDVVWNVASESHVDRSITDPVPFVTNNVAMQLNLLEWARRQDGLALFLQMSTDEVYGPAADGHLHAEGEPHRPSNPYSASKSAQEALAFAWWRTYDVPVVVTNTMNIFGETQDVEKYFAKVMRAVSRGEPVTVHARQVQAPDMNQGWHWRPGSRFYLHARNLADAWLFLTRRYLEPGTEVPLHLDGLTGHADVDRWNVVGEEEVDNVQLAHAVAHAMGRDSLEFEYVDFHSSRPGHDLRYALDGRRLADAGWVAPVSLREGIQRTVDWTLRHPAWL